MRELNAEENLLISGGLLSSDGVAYGDGAYPGPGTGPAGNWVTIDTGFSCQLIQEEPGLGTVQTLTIWTAGGMALGAFAMYVGNNVYTGAIDQYNAVSQQIKDWVATQTGVPTTQP